MGTSRWMENSIIPSASLSLLSPSSCRPNCIKTSGKLGLSATLDIVQIGHPNEHPMTRRQGGPLGVQDTEMSTIIVFLNIESADVNPGQESLQKIPLISVILKALIEVLKIFGKYHAFLFSQIFWGDIDVQRFF